MRNSIQELLPSSDWLGAHSGYSRDLMPIVLAGLAVAVVVAVWALVFRPRPRPPHSFERGLRNATRKRRSRRSERRNPTLAETGGLPPGRNGKSFGA